MNGLESQFIQDILIGIDAEPSEEDQRIAKFWAARIQSGKSRLKVYDERGLTKFDAFNERVKIKELLDMLNAMKADGGYFQLSG